MGGQLALDLSLDGGKLALSYKGFFLFLKKFKKKKKTMRETHEGFLFTSKIFSQTRNAFINSTKGVSELDSYPDSLAG